VLPVAFYDAECVNGRVVVAFGLNWYCKPGVALGCLDFVTIGKFC